MFATRKTRAARTTAAVLGMAIVAAGCSSQGGAGSQEAGSPGPNAGKAYTIAVVTHEAAGESFWDKVRAGVEQAATDHDITLKYSNSSDASQQATLVQNAIDSRVDGLAVTLAYPDAVGPAARKALQAGIPTVAFNAGLDTYPTFGIPMFFGSDEDLGGQTIGQRIGREGGTKALCVIHEQGNAPLETRCAGLKKTFPNTEVLYANGSDLPALQSTVQSKLTEDRSITNIVTLGAAQAMAVLPAKNQAGSQARIETFDLNADAVKAIQDGSIEFAVDQQPYVQGYLAVTSLWLALTNGNDIGGGRPVLTGPSIVDSSNITAIAGFAARNTR